MPRSIGRSLFAWTLITCFCAGSYAQAPGQQLAVAHALAVVEEWLGDAPSAQGWRTYLRLSELQSQAALGSAAEKEVVAAVLERLESGKPGLDRPQLARLRKAVATWYASLVAPTREQLPDLPLAAKNQFQPADAKRVAEGLRHLSTHSGIVHRFLQGSAAGAGWRKYLKLDQLDAQLKPGAKPSLDALSEVLTQLRSEQVGLDQTPFTELAAALADYIAVVRDSQNPNLRAEFEAHLAKLSEGLKAYVQTPSPENLAPVGVELDWLTSHRQAEDLVDAITHRLSQPNLFVSVAGNFLSAGLNRQVDEAGPLRDMILGTRIVGNGRTQGDVTFRLLPDPDVAALEATLEGVNRSQNTGYNGPAVIRTIGTTRLVATKRLSIDINGIHGAAANVGADTSSQITSIGSSKRGVMGCVVERVATKRVAQQKGQAERIASRHAEDRLGTQFEQQIGKELANSNEQFLERFRNPLLRRGALPHVDFSSSSERLFVTALQAHGAQLGAQSEPPAVIDRADIALRLHESLVNNFTAGTLAGETIGQPELEKFAKDFLGEVPERLKDDPDRDPWTITFDDVAPVTFLVADGGFTFIGRGKKYTSGDRSFPAMNFTVKYRLEKLEQGIKATRIGDIEIFPPDFVPGAGKPLSLRHTTLRRLMMRRLAKIFEPEIVKPQPTELKGRWQPAGPLEVVGVEAQAGWLNLGWRQLRPATNVAQAAGRESGTQHASH